MEMLARLCHRDEDVNIERTHVIAERGTRKSSDSPQLHRN